MQHLFEIHQSQAAFSSNQIAIPVTVLPNTFFFENETFPYVTFSQNTETTQI